MRVQHVGVSATAISIIADAVLPGQAQQLAKQRISVIAVQQPGPQVHSPGKLHPVA